MQQVFEFVGNHPLLVLATVGVVIAIIVTEVMRLRSGSSSIEPTAATLLYNKEDALFVDTRAEADFRKSHLPGAINIPANAIEQRLERLEGHRGTPIIVYCATGIQSGRSAAQLKKHGFAKVYQLRGGLAAWQGAGYPLEGK